MKTLLLVWWSIWLDTPPEYGTLIIYRRKEFFQENYIIKINDVTITKNFKAYQYIKVEVPTGKITIETSAGYLTEKKSFSITIQPRQTVYLKGVVEYDYFSNALYLVKSEEDKMPQILKKLGLNVQLVKRLE